MKWVSIADLRVQGDPRLRLAQQAQYLQECVAQAKLDQTERHHAERLRADAEIAEVQGRAIVERERIAGENAIALATRNHALGQAANMSALVDEMVRSHLKEQETWANTMADTLRQVLVTEADTIRQERLKEMDHRHTVEKLTLENNLRLVEMVCSHELQDLRVSYDKACEIAFRLVERALGLGPDGAEPDQVRAWVREAMEQTGGY